MAKLFCCTALCILFIAKALSQTRPLPANNTNRLSANNSTPPKALKGDSTTAILARHHIYTGNEVIAQLGYIDTTVATVKELSDNLLIGLVALPGDDYEIVSFSFSALPKGRDLVGPFTVMVNQMKMLQQSGASPGDKLYFDDIKARRKGSDHTFKIRKGIAIRVLE